MLVSGIALAAKGQGRPTENDVVDPVDLRPPGYALLGVGAAIFTAGVSMIVVDAVRCHKDRLECGARGRLFQRAMRPRVQPRVQGVAWR
jgi:hypothetical protein